MENKVPFSTPISLCAGREGTIRTVKTVNGASEVLTDWPHAKRGPVYQETVSVIEQALAGSVTAAEAHSAFEGFARHAGVLCED